MDASSNDWVLTSFKDFEHSLNGEAKQPLHAKRLKALDEYKKVGFPTVKDEEWRYTNPEVISQGGFSLYRSKECEVLAKDFETFKTSGLEAYTVYIINGMPILPKTTEGGFTIESIKAQGAGVLKVDSIADSRDQFVAINTSFLQDGLVISVKRNQTIQKPIELVWVTTTEASGSFICPRVFVEVEANASCTIIERFCTSLETAGYLTNSVLEFRVQENAKLFHYRVQMEAVNAFHVSMIQAVVSSNAQLSTHTFSFGGKLVRNNIQVLLDGSGISTTLNGLTAVTKEQHVDNHTLLDHAKPHCESHELYKGIYDDKSQGVFSGTIIVREDAQKTNAIQSNRSILLTDEASVNTKPQLKIWADDVKCTHGATIGQLDEDALFYIRSRGVPEAEAKVMLIHAFASEVINVVTIEPLRVDLERQLLTKLQLDG